MSLVIALFMGAEKSGTEDSSIHDPPDLFPFYVCAKIWVLDPARYVIGPFITLFRDTRNSGYFTQIPSSDS